MTVDTKEYRRQLEAAYTLLSENTTTVEKFEKIRVAIKGVNPQLDVKLAAVATDLSRLKAVWNTDIIHLSSHALPERSPEEMKRKKYLLVLITSWKSLKGEVKRVQGYVDNQVSDPTTQQTVLSVAKTGLFAKGPFGLITMAAIIAVTAAVLLKVLSPTSITITNQGCPPIQMPAKLPINLPGMQLPTGQIMPGATSHAKLPGLTATVSTTTASISGTVFGQTGTYRLPANTIDVRFDEESLMNQTREIKLSSSKAHQLTLICR